MSESLGYTKAEGKYIKGWSYLRSKNAAYLIAENNGKPSGRLFTWVAGGKGYFALLDGEGAEKLIYQMEAFQREQGSAGIIGPIAPDGSGWFMGQRLPGDKGALRGEFTSLPDVGQCAALSSMRYAPLNEFAAFEVKIPAANPYKKAADRFAQRLNLRVENVRRGLFSSNITDAVWQTSGEHKMIMTRLTEKLLPTVSTRHSFVVFDEKRNYTGYALTLGSRIATIYTVDNAFRHVSALLLVSAICDSFITSGTETAELSVINRQNTASMNLCQGLGGQEKAGYMVYNKNLT